VPQAATLDLQTARAIVAAALALRRERGYAPLTVVVLDAGGHLVALEREDGASILRPQIAVGKASGALGMGSGSRTLGELAAARPSFIASLASIAPGGFVPVPGGVLVRPAGEPAGSPLGAVGISGDTSDRDEECAVHAIVSVGLSADPG
jgi:uncharacterized protein GlcG (DUF336 family)